MSKLLDQIKKDRLQAMKDGNKIIKDSLTTLYGDLSTAEKNGENIDDKFVIKKVKKTIENLDFIFQNGNGNEESSTKAITEIQYLEKYIPKQYTQEELRDIIKDQEFADIGDGMKWLNKTIPGQFNGKEAKQVILDSLK